MSEDIKTSYKWENQQKSYNFTLYAKCQNVGTRVVYAHLDMLVSIEIHHQNHLE